MWNSQAILISRRVVSYDTRPLVLWSDDTAQTSPNGKTQETKPTTNPFSTQDTLQRFPLEKLVSPRPTPAKEPPTPPMPPDVEDMDWTPSQRQEIRPTYTGHIADSTPVSNGPLPFYGSLPAAPKPLSWQLRNPVVQKPAERVAEPNPFYRVSTQPQEKWGHTSNKEEGNDPHPPPFAQPTFFPPGDHNASTGLEALFDRAFTIRSPDDKPNGDRALAPKLKPLERDTDAHRTFFVAYFRLVLLVASVIAWQLSQSSWISAPGNYVEIISLGSASLIAGFALLETLKQPIVHWNGMEIFFLVVELGFAVYLGANLPRISFDRGDFDNYGKSLLVFMAAQETLSLFFSYPSALAVVGATNPRRNNPSNP
jgi:hypothetical protein